MDVECKTNGTKSEKNSKKWHEKIFWNVIRCKLYELGN